MASQKKNYKRIVIKIGSSLFYDDKKRLNLALLDDFSAQICRLVKEKREIVVVTSGAIALGMSLLELVSRPKELAVLQAAAAVGQNELMSRYAEVFKKRMVRCGQVLLTWDDFTSRKRYLNAKNTLDTLLKFGVVPVINENDTVSTDEIRFGDNDHLSALVATSVCADLLIILSDVEGLLKKDKKTVVRTVFQIDAAVTALAETTRRNTSVGGMITKIKAAKVAVDSGIPCVITGGRIKDVIETLARDPEAAGTLFVPKKSNLSQKQRWIAFSARPKASIVVDDGARSALLERKSLLSVGVKRVEGAFSEGDIVRLVGSDSREFARGKAGVASKLLEKVLGTRFDKEVIHRDDIAILE